jgi:antitoxin component YwqK of YwqJK toxin-antitoxin module
LHGTWTWYRANGALLQRGNIDHDVKHGRWERWDAQGRPLDTGDYDQDRKSGDWTTYNPDGTIKAVKRHGPKR